MPLVYLPVNSYLNEGVELILFIWAELLHDIYPLFETNTIGKLVKSYGDEYLYR